MTIGTLSPTEKDLYKIVALVRQLAEGTAPVFQNQYNLERGRQLDAITGMYGAGNTTGGLLSSLDRARLANMQAGIGAADAALNAQMWGPTQMLAVEAQRRGIPLQALAAQYGMVLPAAQAFGTQTGSGTSAGASSGQSASSSAGTSTSRSVGSDTSQTTQSTPFNPLSLLPYAFTAMPATSPMMPAEASRVVPSWRMAGKVISAMDTPARMIAPCTMRLSTRVCVCTRRALRLSATSTGCRRRMRRSTAPTPR